MARFTPRSWINPSTPTAKHELTEYEHDPKGYRAVCRCGWKSPSGAEIDDAYRWHLMHVETDKEQGNDNL